MLVILVGLNMNYVVKKVIAKTKEWEYSFYCDASKDTSCFELAKSINPKGGGHKQAAGCVSKEFIFK